MPLLTFRFVSQDNLPSRLIEMEEAAPYPIAHVGVITDDSKYEFGARLGVNGSLTGRSGVQYRPVDYADFTSEVYVQLQITQAQHDAFWLAAGKIQGDLYAIKEILGIVVDHDFADRGKFVCSPAMAWLLGVKGVDLLPKELHGHERLITPVGFYYLCLGLRDGTP